ncbi:hypothetical protein GBA65_03060 [Rubrobacter marinus]|uniref:Peptide zinc metalloprotease protein n=1 Tax=Rubrobacter marinus TaxID=2653852 RepID=A0A6G8PTI8_9ACTN|nr:hypothetical protein [Rubrobacter marinus]QIN77654.1 hypothetical protein GBA65_03060 [Rubrobacter marinus]
MPERPERAPDVEIVGEMKETGFEDRQWLVQRGDRFIQLTELLYRVVEQSDGERTLREVAAGVTASTDWAVEADDVRRMIGTKLIPLGLISPAEDADDHGYPADVREGPRSPLALNMRTKAIGPRVIDPVSGVLRLLFAPPILVPILLAVVAAHWWLYAVHGVMGSVVAFLRTPGLVLVVLAATLLAGVFHEFGHASALRYGGGRARAMGAGLYIVYPAFYTDTTDAYRLGRWGRVRTDLGGFYFSLIFALGLMALYAVTGQEILLFVVLLINLDIVYQCLPFVRFDGYWALADLSGIPDFFSQMGAFLRSVLPLRRWKGARLPNLKPRVKTVFAAYVLVTVPVLSLLLFSLVSNLPSIASTAWESLRAQATQAARALDDGLLLDVAAATVEALLLTLQMLAILYLLYNIGRRFVRAVLTWSRPTPLRRAIGASLVVGVISLVAFLWAA